MVFDVELIFKIRPIRWETPNKASSLLACQYLCSSHGSSRGSQPKNHGNRAGRGTPTGFEMPSATRMQVTLVPDLPAVRTSTIDSCIVFERGATVFRVFHEQFAAEASHSLLPDGRAILSSTIPLGLVYCSNIRLVA